MANPDVWEDFEQACASGQEERVRKSFEMLFREKNLEMVRFAQWCANGHNREKIAGFVLDPDEIVQEAFTELYRRRPIVRRTIREWFLGTIRNKIRFEVSKAWREEKDKRPAQRELDRVRRQRGTRSSVSKEQMIALREAIKSLPPRLRAVIIALYFRAESIATTAKTLGITENGVVKARSRAIKRLGDILAKRGSA